ncbi:MAG: hypothetical protein QNM02_14540 [Acidimicrobiia bacterium]|nr:hypothetical protein [Acidimicrobiia bacterium]
MKIVPVVSLRRRRTCAAFAVVMGVATLSVGASAAVAAEHLETTPPDTTPVTTPDTTPVTTPDTIPDNGGDSDTPWGWIIAIGAVTILIVALVASAAGRRGATTRTGSAVPPPHPNTADQDRGYALGSAQWVHDHLAPELLAAPPAQAASRWAAERSRLDDTVIRAQQYVNDPTSGISWQRLGQAVSLLGISLDSYIHLRNEQPPNQPQIDESYAVAYQHHAELGAALAQLWPIVQR